MPITLLDFIRSGGDFALLGAKDVEMPDGSRLDAVMQHAMDALDALETPAASVDLTDFESGGTIIERRPDGSTVEQQMEFDENKIPIKIRHIVKNSDGEVLEENETSLIGFAEVGGGGSGGSGGLSPADEARLSELESKTDAMQKDIGDLQETTGGIQDAIEKMQGVAEGAISTLLGVQQNIGDLQTATGSMQQDIGVLQETTGGMQIAIEKMQGVAEGALGALASVQQDITELQQAAAPAKNVDLSRFESNGEIVQTGADGSTVTSTFTFDGSGNITKVIKVQKDANGQIIEEHETTWTW